ncbi:MAG TPA: tetratricopeptide repeat protein [Smithellaceae bacterium]|nr:tetratricopeptide repeat protein [Smithellaceae bacterium]
METMVYRKSSATSEIMKKLDESRRHLRTGNLFSCIVTLRDVLDAFLHDASIDQADRSKITSSLNHYQQQIATAAQFRDLYGMFTFRDSDFTTTYDFLGQLITIKEDEIASVLIGKDVKNILNLESLDSVDQQTAKTMLAMVERGEQMVLRELVAANDNIATLVLSYYNEMGIGYRLSGDTDKAIQEYKKALSISPDDENLFYNLARVYIEIGNKKKAEECIGRALKLNPDFIEGFKLQNYINNWTP